MNDPYMHNNVSKCRVLSGFPGVFDLRQHNSSKQPKWGEMGKQNAK